MVKQLYCATLLNIYTHKKEKEKKYDAQKLLPVLLYLRKWQETIISIDPISNLPTLIEKYHLPNLPQGKELRLPPNWAKNHLNQGTMLIMFDGFDEVKEEWRKPISEWIGKEMENYPKTIFILTSRPAGYKDFATEYKLTAELIVKPFNQHQQEQFINKWYRCQEKYSRGGRDTPDVKAEADRNTVNLMQQLKEKSELDDLAKNPLLLNIMANLHRSYSGEKLPTRRTELYREIISLQLGDSPLARNIKMLLPANESQQILQSLALYMVKEDKIQIELDLLIKHLNQEILKLDEQADSQKFLKEIEDISELLVKRDEHHEFSHNSFQGYLASVEIIQQKQDHLLLENWDKKHWKETILLYACQVNPNNLLRGLIKINTQESATLAYECIKETPRKVDPEIEAELKNLESRVSNIFYQQLETYLANQQWQEADIETNKLMLKVAGKEENQGLDAEDIEKFPCEDLKIINDLWLKYSDGRFGFSVQKEIYFRLEGTKEYNPVVWEKFCEEVGWKKEEEWRAVDVITQIKDIRKTNLGQLPVFLIVLQVERRQKGQKVWTTSRVFFANTSSKISSLASRLVNCDV